MADIISHEVTDVHDGSVVLAAEPFLGPQLVGKEIINTSMLQKYDNIQKHEKTANLTKYELYFVPLQVENR